MKITISEGLGWLKTLKGRHAELDSLRNQNSSRSRRMWGSDENSKEILTEPTYDIKAIDKLSNGVAKEVRKLDEAIKRMNAKTNIDDYDKNEDILGEL